MENQRKIEGLIIIAFIVFIILVVFILILMFKGTSSNTSPNSNPDKSSGVIYNYYNFTTINDYRNPYQGKVVYNHDRKVVYNHEENIWGNGREELEYSSYSKHIREKNTFGNYVEEFYVYVENEDSVGGYFEVVFYFENCYGDEFTEALTKYIKPGETEKFKYMEIWYKEKGICDWEYDVFS